MIEAKISENAEQQAKALGFEEPEELASKILENIKKDKQHVISWRKDAKECYDFEAGNQWSVEDKALLEESGRPPVVFNRIVRTINAVAGLEIQNRHEVRYIPREMGDVGVNEVLTGAAKYIRDNCDAEDEESEAFRDLLICGMGVTETRMDYEVDDEGKAIIDRVDPLEAGWDFAAKKKNLDDARRVWRAREFTKSETKERWPDADIQPQKFWLDTEDEEHLADQAWKYENNATQGNEESYSVVQYQWYELKTYHKVLTAQGQIVEFDHEKWEKIGPQVMAMGMALQHQKLKRRAYYQAFLSNNTLLEVTEGPCKESFTLRFMTGIRDRNRNVWFGLVSIMRDPQRWANKWLSQIMHILNSNSKGGLLAESSAFQNPRKAEEDWASPDSIIWLNEGGLGKIQERGMGAYPATVDKLLSYAVDSINDVVGVNAELMGIADRMQAGILESMRKQSGITILAPYFDALRRYRKEQGRVLAYFIMEYMSDGRLVRILGEEGQQYVPLTKDPQTFKYDVIVDDSPSSPNMKERTFFIMMELLPHMLSAGLPVPPEVLDYAPLPENLVQKWKQQLQPDPQQVQEQQQVKQIAVAKEIQDISESKSKEVLNYAKAQTEGVKPVFEADKIDLARSEATVNAFKVGTDAANPDRGML